MNPLYKALPSCVCMTCCRYLNEERKVNTLEHRPRAESVKPECLYSDMKEDPR